MKYRILFLFLFIQLGVFAQQRFQGGMVLGPVTSQMSGDRLAGWNKFGVTMGGFVSLGVGENGRISAGMQYILKGSRTKQDTITFQSFAYRLSYLEMPILYHFDVKNLRFSIGPTIGILLSQGIMANGLNYELNESEEFKPTEIGGLFGIGYRLGEKSSLEIRYTNSIIPIRDAPFVVNPLSFYEKGNYNNVLQFVLVKAF